MADIQKIIIGEDIYDIKDATARASLSNLSASAITSGTLPASRGGTGQTSLQATRNAMGLGNTTGVLPVANGGTGQTSLQATRNAMGLGNTTGALPIANGGTGQTGVTIQSSIGTVITAQSNVTVTGVNTRKWGPIMSLKIAFKFKNDITIPASGNITNVTLMTLASDYRPVAAIAFHDTLGDVAYFGDIAADGTITLRGANATGSSYTISKDTQRYINAVFFTA